MVTAEFAEELASYAVELDFERLDEKTKNTAKNRIIDSVACAVSALPEDPPRRILEYTAKKRGTTNARILATSETASIEYAGFANASLIRYVDWNDEYGEWSEEYQARSAGHPSCNIGALLAAADAYDCSGKDLLRATVIAYEVQCRFSDVVVLKEDGFDHVSWGLVASALGAGTLMGLSKDELVQSINIALAGHLALRQSRAGEISEWKGLAFGNAVRNAFVAIELAREGIHGPSEIFEGEFGLYSHLSHPPELNVEDFGGRQGEFRINKTNIKRYPIGYHIQGAVDCVFSLLAEEEIPLEEIDSIEIETYERAVNVTAGDDEKWNPQNRNAADHSLPYCVARAFIDEEMTLEQFTEEKVADPMVRELMNKIEVEHSEAAGTQGDRPTHIVTVSTGTSTYRRSIKQQKGHHRNPLSEEEMVTKVRSATGRVLSETDIDELFSLVDTLENESSCREIFDIVDIAGTNPDN